MDYKLVWLLEQRVILLQLVGDYSEALLRQQIDELRALVEQGSPPIYVIVDTSGATTMPKNFREPLNIMTDALPENKVAWVLFVTNNALFRFLGNVAGKFMGY